MSITCQNIVDSAEIILHDTGNADFAAADLFTFLKTCQRKIASIKPDASVTNASVQLATGTKQSIPTGGIQLINVTRNMGTDGSTAGEAIQFCDLATMNDLNPDWNTDTASATVQNYIFDSKNPKSFYVYPPQPGSDQGYVEEVYAVTPADPASIAAAITLDDIYEPALLHMLLHMVYSIDAAQSPYASQQSQYHWNMAVTLLDRKDLKEQTDAPRPE